MHINVTTSTAGDSYRKLGDLLGMETEAQRLGAYCDKVYGEMVELTASVEKVDALYLLGAEGSNVIARDSYHSEVMDLMTNNLAVVESPSSKGTGNEVDLGIPDVGKEDEVWVLIEEQLPEDVKSRFDHLPLTMEEAPYASFG